MNGLYHPIRLDSGEITGNLLLAPMAGYTDMAFRQLAVEHGANLAFTEMISAEAVARGNQKTMRLARKAPNETIYGIQLFTSNEQSAAACAKMIAGYQPFLIDLNCGCSAPKICKSGAGAELLKDPEKIGRIVGALRDATPVPVSIKLRLGWDASSYTYIEAAQAAVANGACLVTLHPRTRAQGFSGQADWAHIKLLKGSIPVPVIGSGDLFTPQDAHLLLSQTGCDGVMFARGAIGNPFIFENTRELLIEGHIKHAATDEEKLQAALKQMRLMLDYKCEKIAAREMRKHFAHFTKGLANAAALRRLVNHAETYKDYETIVHRHLSCE